MNFDWNAITVIAGLGMLVYYEIHRQFPKEKKRGWREFVERNWPRGIFTATLVPGTANVMTDWIQKVAG